MELRKVQLTGGSSITVTLPKAWVEKVELRAGDVVGCDVLPDGSLAILPHAKGERKVQRYVVDFGEGEGEYLFRKIIAAYLMGYDAIVVTSKRPLPPVARHAVREAVRRIIGIEIVEEEANTITLQDFLDPREFHLDKALRRMSLLTQAMQDEAFAALTKPDPGVLKSVEDRDDEVDRLYWLVNKQYHAMLRDATYAAKMELTPSQALNFLLVARLVERTADHADRIAEQALLVPRSKAVDQFLAKLDREGRRAADLFRASLVTFTKRDAKRANAIIEEVNVVLKGRERLLEEAASFGGASVSHLAIIVESIGRTAAYAADIGEVAMNHKVSSPA
ncbi:MAG TPA: phosphate uptake regulator PhoU [Candidatus Thermoplasmatota archaeon]|nr:phosphate uptake regulator PhoU [Candidatus Thermoplasmatota archaeon]